MNDHKKSLAMSEVNFMHVRMHENDLGRTIEVISKI